ncbi:hypothetical protein J2849_006168 [Azospirillum melinis]|nr:hypothetical protein [Azospirillum melinis]
MKSEAEVLLPACQAGAQRPAAHTRGPMIPGATPEEALRKKRRKGDGAPYVRLSRATTICLANDVRAYLTSHRVAISLVRQEG